MEKEQNTVTYKCQACGAEFKTYQGSRRRFCDKCTADRVARKDRA